MENQSIFHEWWEQFKSPWRSSSFQWYFWGVVVAIGCVGIYPSIYRLCVDTATFFDVAESIITYSIALIMPSCIPILLSIYKTDKKVSLVVCSILCYVIMPIALAIITYLSDCLIFVLPLLFISWFTWIVANHDNVDLRDETYNDKIKKESRKRHGKNWN